jgi:hypothetical protein
MPVTSSDVFLLFAKPGNGRRNTMTKKYDELPANLLESQKRRPNQKQRVSLNWN